MIQFLDQINPWHWWGLATVLIAIEVFAPTTLFLWTGIAAAIVGLVALGMGDMRWELQMVLFATLSVLSVGIWRLAATRAFVNSTRPPLNRRAHRHVGQLFVLDGPIIDGRGWLTIEGTLWRIEGEDLDAGIRIRVTGVNGSVFIVERV